MFSKFSKSEQEPFKQKTGAECRTPLISDLYAGGTSSHGWYIDQSSNLGLNVYLYLTKYVWKCIALH